MAENYIDFTAPQAKVAIYMSSSTSLLQTKKNIQSTKFLLDCKACEYEEYDVSIDKMRLHEMVEKSGKSDLPQIYINNEYIGGYEELASLNETGNLDELLAVALKTKQLL
eukprot:TRINITY_DN1560_c0_g1_i1.p1 TRINITY_DN1560_c0_g1~~TRINITY_DN1560_c0_g1_i1.p1  ORF type:complete len:119 (-),score=21.04 TRINITY_DN1560_c0_g1_i1:28-357(-)